MAGGRERGRFLVLLRMVQRKKRRKPRRKEEEKALCEDRFLLCEMGHQSRRGASLLGP